MRKVKLREAEATLSLAVSVDLKLGLLKARSFSLHTRWLARELGQRDGAEVVSYKLPCPGRLPGRDGVEETA